VHANAKDDMEIVCMGKCIECNTEKKIRQENEIFDINDVESDENYFNYDEMNFSESSDMCGFEMEINSRCLVLAILVVNSCSNHYV
jgi:hypothetical protein